MLNCIRDRITKILLYGGESWMLTELAIKQLVPREKAYSLQGGQGLILDVRPNGKKYWVIRYWLNGKEKRTSIGSFPEVTLREARMKNMEFRKSLKSGKPLGIENETFSTVAEEWYKRRMVPNSAESYLRSIRLRFNKYVFPSIGHMKLPDITAGIVLQICRKIEDKGFVETAARTKAIIGQVLRYAIATDRISTDVTLALRGAMQKRQAKHFSAITEPAAISILMKQIDAYPYDILRLAMKFSALVFCRPGEIRRAEWSEINFKEAEWRIPPEKMKMKRLHIAPLARQTVAVLMELKTLTGHQKWLFPSARQDGRCMSENAVRVALRSMGYANQDMTAHGFRAMASTTLNDTLRFPQALIEWQLSHVDEHSVILAYNRGEYIKQRHEMMQWWADWLDEQKNKVPN
jgi:integrase